MFSTIKVYPILFHWVGIPFYEFIEQSSVNNVLHFPWLETKDLEWMTMSRFMSLTSLCIKIWVEFIFVVGSWSKGALVWEFINGEPRVDILDFYLYEHGMILVYRLKRCVTKKKGELLSTCVNP
jgi:hypothetical protein